jgi:hypothetical protein
MYTLENGKKVLANIHVASLKLNVQSPSPTEKTAGGNKDVLYASLALGVIVLLLGLYMLYRHLTMKKLEKFGYRL